MSREASQDFRDLVNSLKQIIDKDTPPETSGERRKCMVDIMNLLSDTQGKLRNVDPLN